MQFKNLQIFDLTAMFPTDTPTDVATAKARIAEVMGGQQEYYPYDSGTDYYEIPEVVTSGACVDLGSLNWTYVSEDTRFYCYLASAKGFPESHVANAFCKLYRTVRRNDTPTIDMSVSINEGSVVNIHDSRFTDGASLKSALNGVYLYYQRATDESWYIQNKTIYRTSQLVAGQIIRKTTDGLPNFTNLPTGYLQMGVDTEVQPSAGSVTYLTGTVTNYDLTQVKFSDNTTKNIADYRLPSTLGTANQVLKMNSSASATEWGTLNIPTYTAGDGISVSNNVITNADHVLVPQQASSQNQLADKAFVNSTIQTATANFRGNWNTWTLVPTDSSQYPEDYAGSKIPTVNDYLAVIDASDYTGSQTLSGTWRFKYSGVWSTSGKSGWLPEYQVNETPMTAAQLAAINSGITSSKVSTYDGYSTSKQDTLPTVTNDRYLHTNASTGALEWSQLIVPDNIFKATYGSTTYEELRAAYIAGKTIVTEYAGRFYYVVSPDSTVGGTFYFVSLQANASMWYVWCSSNNVWQYSVTYLQGKLPTATSGKYLRATSANSYEWADIDLTVKEDIANKNDSYQVSWEKWNTVIRGYYNVEGAEEYAYYIGDPVILYSDTRPTIKENGKFDLSGFTSGYVHEWHNMRSYYPYAYLEDSSVTESEYYDNVTSVVFDMSTGTNVWRKRNTVAYDPNPTKGDIQYADVTSVNPADYPANGVQDSYWYIRKDSSYGSTAYPSKKALVDGLLTKEDKGYVTIGGTKYEIEITNTDPGQGTAGKIIIVTG